MIFRLDGQAAGGKPCNSVEDFPTYDGLNILQISFIDDRNYDLTKRERIGHFYKIFNNEVRFINAYIEDKDLDEWAKHCDGHKSFMTDALRIALVNAIGNCIYFDNDVFLTSGFINDFNKYKAESDTFIINESSGTFLYNKNKNSEILNDWYNYYNNILVKEPFEENSDVIVFRKWNNKRIQEGKTLLSNYPYSYNICHFTNVQHFLNPDLMIYNGDIDEADWCKKTKMECLIVPKEAFWSFCSYCIPKGFLPRFATNLDEITNANILIFR